MKKTFDPVYQFPADYARENGQLEEYRASRKLNMACKHAIEDAIRENYRDNRLDPAAAKSVVEEFGFERTLHVLAATVKAADWDGRYSRENKQWAQIAPIYPDTDGLGGDRNDEFRVSQAHPGLIDLFLTEVRHEQLLATPLKAADIRREALSLLARLENLHFPNSPDREHFTVEVSKDFLARAKSKDLDKLAALIPFESGVLSSLKDRQGVYLIVGKDEDRHQGLAKRGTKASIVNRLKTPREQTTTETAAPKKKDELER